MGEFNLGKIEFVNLCDLAATEIEDDFSRRWEILTRNANIPWRFELTCPGENGEAFVYDSLEAR